MSFRLLVIVATSYAVSTQVLEYYSRDEADTAFSLLLLHEGTTKEITVVRLYR